MYKEKIKELDYYINEQERKRSSYIKFMMITVPVILGGGLVLGLLFGALAKIMMLAVAAGVFVNVKAIKEIGDASEEIARCNHQIAVYRNNNKEVKKETKEVKKEIKKEIKNNYSYKPENNKKEVKIERFTEKDYYDNDNHKTR